MKVHLVLQSFGREYEYKRAILAIWSFFAHNKSKINHEVFLFTDKPSYFKNFLEGLPVKYNLLTDEKITSLKGDIDFIHRMKIGIIKEVLEVCDSEDSLFYIDSDTFFISDPKEVFDRISPDTFFMHLREYAFKDLEIDKLALDSPMRVLLPYIEKESFSLTNSHSFDITLEHSSWNAGAMVFDPSHLKYFEDVYSITEQLYPATMCHASEQFAFSVVFQERFQILSCDETVFHYWHRVKKEIIDAFLNELLIEKWAELNIEKKKKEVFKLTKTLPIYIEKHPKTYENNSLKAFYENDFKKGYTYALKRLLKAPINFKFIKDVLYHTKQIMQK